MRITHLPRADEGVDGILRLADALTDEEVFEFIRLVRTTGRTPEGANRDVGRPALAALAQRMVSREMANSAVEFDEARKRVAKKLGYDETERTNFYKILAGQVRPDSRYTR
ncbi:hypothetical protein AB0F93_00505 [Micromonospora tulbaghiae]|uniref:hypothetical protein n=1 Tax=Micromonospora tulbaghiae TaxID=479978 RepID=UPI0033307F01